jgi:hypothetical protein
MLRSAIRASSTSSRSSRWLPPMAYLGHRNIQHTVRYTELSPTRFKNLWRD